jgi:triosephosphate isomerase
VVVAPTALHLAGVQSSLKGPIQVAAQNCSASGNGAFTGEHSADMLKDHNVNWVILGHSERRTLYKEDDTVRVLSLSLSLTLSISLALCPVSILGIETCECLLVLCAHS